MRFSITFLLFILLSLTGVLFGQECPVNFQEGSRIKCYFPNIAFNNWENTRRTCRMFSKLGNLAKIDSEDKLKAIVDNSDYFLKGELSLSFWIGLKYVRGKWLWIDGTPLSDVFQPWAKVNRGQLRRGVQNCAALNLYTAVAQNASQDQGKWHIDDCSAPRASLCQTFVKKAQKTPALSQLVALFPQKAIAYFEKQPDGHSCTHGVNMYRFKDISLCAQMCLVNTECAGYIVPKKTNDTCVLKSRTCRSTFSDPLNTYFKKDWAKISQERRARNSEQPEDVDEKTAELDVDSRGYEDVERRSEYSEKREYEDSEDELDSQSYDEDE